MPSTNKRRTVDDTAEGILTFLQTRPNLRHTGPWGKVLTSLATAIFKRDIAVGDTEYHYTSLAVLELEEMGLVEVDRAYARDKAKANIIQAITLQEGE